MFSRHGYTVRWLSHAVARRPKELFTPVIGLEVHVQLNTRSKLFSPSPVGDEAPPNSTVHPHDMAIPGTLPRLNKRCLMMSLQMGSLLNCEIPEYCRFDRKHYFYADMPAGYQITQNERPVAKNGLFKYYVYDESVETYEKEVRILQLQLEQDSGKTIHHSNTSLIDLNRAGAPLVEVVTDADLCSALEAVCLVQQLRLILMHHGICGGQMHKGQMRVDANVSLSEGGTMGVRTEVKNMNSFRHLHTAINYEIDRQYRILAEGGRVINETRACDQHGRTVSMRDKEEETDYRFMAEPNLPIVKIRPEWLSESFSRLQSSDLPPYQTYIQKLRLDPRTAIHYAEEPTLSAFLERCQSRIARFDEATSSTVANTITPSLFLDWMKDLKQMCQRQKGSFPPARAGFASEFLDVIALHSRGRITRLRALQCMKESAESEEDRDVEKELEVDNLWRITDTSSIDSILTDVISKDEALWKKVLSGNSKSVTRVRNLLLEGSRKCIELKDAEEAVRRRLNSDTTQ